MDDCICSAELWNAVLTGSYTFNGRMTNYGFKNIQVPGETRTCDIHLIYNSKRAMLNSREDIMKGVEAFRKVDFVVRPMPTSPTPWRCTPTSSCPSARHGKASGASRRTGRATPWSSSSRYARRFSKAKATRRSCAAS